MKIFRYWLWIIVLPAFLLKGCIPDDELSKPVKVDLFLQTDENTSGSNYIFIHNIYIAVDEISFYGIRQEGSDIFFQSQPSAESGNYMLNPASNMQLASFDMPQGVYNQMKWELRTHNLPAGFVSDPYTDLFLSPLGGSQNFGMIITADFFEEPDDEPVKVIMGVEPNNVSSFLTTTSNGQTPELQSSQVFRVDLLIKFYQAFTSIEPDAWDDAYIREYEFDDDDNDNDDDDDDDNDDDDNGDDDDSYDDDNDSDDSDEDEIDYMIITSTENQVLYERILFRIESNLSSTIE